MGDGNDSAVVPAGVAAELVGSVLVKCGGPSVTASMVESIVVAVGLGEPAGNVVDVAALGDMDRTVGGETVLTQRAHLLGGGE